MFEELKPTAILELKPFRNKCMGATKTRHEDLYTTICMKYMGSIIHMLNYMGCNVILFYLLFWHCNHESLYLLMNKK